MKYIRDMFKIFKFNFSTLLKFEILFKMILSIFLIPFSKFAFDIIMKLTGFTYLTLENLSKFVLNPVTILFVLLIIVFFTLITLFDISGMLIIYDASYHKKKISLKDTIGISFSKCRNTLKIRNIPIIFFLLFLIPLLNLGISSNVISNIDLPEFILDYITVNKFLSIILLLFYVLLTIIFLRWIYAIHYMIIENKNFRQAIINLIVFNEICNYKI